MICELKYTKKKTTELTSSWKYLKSFRNSSVIPNIGFSVELRFKSFNEFFNSISSSIGASEHLLEIFATIRHVSMESLMSANDIAEATSQSDFRTERKDNKWDNEII